jgi:hypothetical protein
MFEGVFRFKRSANGYASPVECWTCSDTAAATCRFCGRASCRNHAQTLPFVVTAWSPSGGRGEVNALVVEDAVFCGACRPHPAPVRLDLVLEEEDD